MSETANASSAQKRGRRLSRRALVGMIVVAGVLLLVLANVHLLYVAVTTQPDCVAPQAQEGQAQGIYQPAKPAC